MADLLSLNPTTRSRFTVQGLRDRVRSDLAQADTVFISNSDIDAWALEAQDLIARDAQWFQYVTTLLTSGGTRDYDLPIDALSIAKVMYDIWPLAGVTMAELFDANPLWRMLGPSQPRCYYVGGASRITLFPTPPAASGLTIIFSARPPVPVGDLDTYYVPVGGDEALVYYCCWKASVKDAGREGLKRADHFVRMWETALARIVAQSRALGEEAPLIFGGANRRSRRGGNTDPLWRTVPLPGGS